MKQYLKFILSLFLLVAATAFVLNYYFSKLPEKSYFTDKPISKYDSKEKKDEKKTIVFSFGGTDTGGSIKKSVSLFQKAYPGIEVKIQQLPNSTDYQRNFYKFALYTGDDSIDVIYADVIWTAEFASSNWVLPLDKYVNDSVQEEFLTNVLDGCKYNGKLYAFPNKTDAPLLYYRSDIVTAPPKTIKELVELSNAFRTQNGIKYGYVFTAQSYEGLVCTALEFIWNNGGEVVKNGKVVINSPEAVEGLQQLIDIVNSDVATPDVLNFQEEDVRIAFQDGNALFMRNWPYAYNLLNSSNSKVKGKVGFAPLPLGPKGKISRGTLGGWNFMINKNSKNPDIAWEFIKWMSSYDMQVANCITGGFMPTRKLVYDSVEVKKSAPWLAGFKLVFENANLRPATPYYSSISESMQVNFSNALQGKISAKTALENIERDMNEMQANHSN